MPGVVNAGQEVGVFPLLPVVLDAAPAEITRRLPHHLVQARALVTVQPQPGIQGPEQLHNLRRSAAQLVQNAGVFQEHGYSLLATLRTGLPPPLPCSACAPCCCRAFATARAWATA